MKSQTYTHSWQPNAYNVRGQVTDYLLGNNYRTLKSFNDYGFTEQILTQTTGSSPNNIQNEGYNFDELKGNLMSRTNHWPYDKTESFYYDNLNRLTNENVSGGKQLTTSFTNKGNITQKTDIGTYTYGEAGAHAVTGLTSTTGSLLPANDQTIDYTAFNKASHIGRIPPTNPYCKIHDTGLVLCPKKRGETRQNSGDVRFGRAVAAEWR